MEVLQGTATLINTPARGRVLTLSEGFSPRRIIRVERILESSARAAIVQTDMGRAYVKGMGTSDDGPHILACELIGTRLAEWLGLPTLDYGVMELRDEDLFSFPEDSVPWVGSAFVTRSIEAFTWGGTGSELLKVLNPELMSALVVFDTWVLNCDRHRRHAGEVRRNFRNVLLTGEGASRGRVRMVAMDHTHCFTCGAELVASRLGMIDKIQSHEIFGLFPEFIPYVTQTRVAGVLERLAEFDHDAALSVTDGVPPSWGWRQDVRAALVDFLSRRAQFLVSRLPDILENACGWPKGEQ